MHSSISSSTRGGDTNTSTSETNIGPVTVNTRATDADGIARDLRGAMQRFALATQVNRGQV
jgi:hypothetical protein